MDTSFAQSAGGIGCQPQQQPDCIRTNIQKGERSFQLSASLAFAAEGGPLQEWASQKGLPSDLPSICRNDEARKWVLDQLNVTAKESKLKVGRLTQIFMQELHFMRSPRGFLTVLFGEEGGGGGGGRGRRQRGRRAKPKLNNSQFPDNFIWENAGKCSTPVNSGLTAAVTHTCMHNILTSTELQHIIRAGSHHRVFYLESSTLKNPNHLGTFRKCQHHTLMMCC